MGTLEHINLGELLEHNGPKVFMLGEIPQNTQIKRELFTFKFLKAQRKERGRNSLYMAISVPKEPSLK
jgi:hypothetical protein